MKNLLRAVAITLIAITSLVANATNRHYEISLYIQNFDADPFHSKEGCELGNRFASIFGNCGISQDDGIEIHGLTNEILVYEIWDADGTVCLAYFTDEESFIESLFSMTGSFQLKFYFEDYILYGEISL